MVTPPHFTDVASPWTTMLLLGDLGRTMVRTLASRLNQPTGIPALEPAFVLRRYARHYRTALLVAGTRYRLGLQLAFPLSAVLPYRACISIDIPKSS
jgi:hypothetical protein